MFNAYYAAVLQMWTTLAYYARNGVLVDGTRMPLAMKTEILVRLPIVQALVSQGRALGATDFAGHIHVITQLEVQRDAFTRLANRFGLLSAVAMATTPPWRVLQRDWEILNHEDPEMANLLKNNVPGIDNPLAVGGIGLGLGIALTLGGIVALKYLAK